MPRLNIREALSQGRELLKSAEVGEPGLNAEVLLAHAMRCGRVYFFAHPEQELREVEWIHYGRYLHERMQGKPTQYITKKQEFYGRDFRVTPEVLIPRPETELLVEAVLQRRPDARMIVDVGTGSGAIAATLAVELGRPVAAVDISTGALAVAAENAAKLGARVSFAQADLLSCFADGVADVVVSNPPYVASGDAVGMQREVRDWEPHLALFAGHSGMSIYKRLVPEAWRVLSPGGLLAMEIGFGQAEAVSGLVNGWNGLRVLPDLAGILRVVVCEKP